MKKEKEFALATRRSPLAQTQTKIVQSALAEALMLPPDDRSLALPIRTYVTSGDKNLSGSLAAIGGKGLFTKEIEAALLNGEARFAVHSMKDMPAEAPQGLVTAAIPRREDPRDCFISEKAESPWDLPEGALIGAASVRRIAQTLQRRPDLAVTTLRGNVQTRLEKLKEGAADGTFLACAGLNRLGETALAAKALPAAEMLPAVGQGALCLQARRDDHEALELANALNCPHTAFCVAIERAFLAGLDGSCRTPIAGLAELEGDTVRFRGELLSLDGAEKFTTEITLPFDPDNQDAAADAGKGAAADLRAQAGEEFFKALQIAQRK